MGPDVERSARGAQLQHQIDCPFFCAQPPARIVIVPTTTITITITITTPLPAAGAPLTRISHGSAPTAHVTRRKSNVSSQKAPTLQRAEQCL